MRPAMENEISTSILLSVGGAAGGGYSQVIPMEEVFFVSCFVD